MMKVERIVINGNGYIRTWSDTGCYIRREDILYESAVDPDWMARAYTETEQTIEHGGEAEVTDYLTALERFGVV